MRKVFRNSFLTHSEQQPWEASVGKVLHLGELTWVGKD